MVAHFLSIKKEAANDSHRAKRLTSNGLNRFLYLKSIGKDLNLEDRWASIGPKLEATNPADGLPSLTDTDLNFFVFFCFILLFLGWQFRFDAA